LIDCLLRKCKNSTHVDWCFTDQTLECLCADGDAVEEENEAEDLFDFDEGDDLEPDLAAALSPADRQAADLNSLDFQEHVQQVLGRFFWTDCRTFPHSDRTLHQLKLQLQLFLWSLCCYGQDMVDHSCYFASFW
jgi:hypothetical protein